jgi:hypothetical protein
MSIEHKPHSRIFLSNGDQSILRPVLPTHSFVTKDEKQFRIVTKGWKEEPFTPEFEAKLASKVEEAVGKEKLTIILY